MEKKIVANLVRSRKIVPVGKFIILRPREIETESRIALPGKNNGAVAAGMAVLEVEKIGSECSKVLVGDFVISKANAESMATFKLLGDEYLMMHEDDCAVVLRNNE